jgi:hypothetical protein
MTLPLQLLLSLKESSTFFFVRVNPSDPWPGHWTGSMTGSGFKTMVLSITNDASIFQSNYIFKTNIYIYIYKNI